MLYLANRYSFAELRGLLNVVAKRLNTESLLNDVYFIYFLNIIFQTNVCFNSSSIDSSMVRD